MKFLLPAILALGACSPSPLYVDRAQLGTNGVIPRDGRGEPIWSAIGPPPGSPAPLQPPAPPPSSALPVSPQTR